MMIRTTFIVVGILSVYISAEPPVRGYGPPSRPGSHGGRFGSGQGQGFGGQGQGQGQRGPGGRDAGVGGVHRFVSVHVPPGEFNGPPRPPSASGPRVVYGKRDVNYNIIFVRAPVPPPPQQTEVILPQPSEQKTLVYVLVRNPSEQNQNNVKFVYPKKYVPAKPEVFFVQYNNSNNGNKGQGQAGGGGSGQGQENVGNNGGYNNINNIVPGIGGSGGYA